jgi:hypothetical protein
MKCDWKEFYRPTGWKVMLTFFCLANWIGHRPVFIANQLQIGYRVRFADIYAARIGFKVFSCACSLAFKLFRRRNVFDNYQFGLLVYGFMRHGIRIG